LIFKSWGESDLPNN